MVPQQQQKPPGPVQLVEDRKRNKKDKAGAKHKSTTSRSSATISSNNGNNSWPPTPFLKQNVPVEPQQLAHTLAVQEEFVSTGSYDPRKANLSTDVPQNRQSSLTEENISLLSSTHNQQASSAKNAAVPKANRESIKETFVAGDLLFTPTYPPALSSGDTNALKRNAVQYYAMLELLGWGATIAIGGYAAYIFCGETAEDFAPIFNSLVKQLTKGTYRLYGENDKEGEQTLIKILKAGVIGPNVLFNMYTILQAVKIIFGDIRREIGTDYSATVKNEYNKYPRITGAVLTLYEFGYLTVLSFFTYASTLALYKLADDMELSGVDHAISDIVNTVTDFAGMYMVMKLGTRFANWFVRPKPVLDDMAALSKLNRLYTGSWYRAEYFEKILGLLLNNPQSSNIHPSALLNTYETHFPPRQHGFWRRVHKMFGWDIHMPFNRLDILTTYIMTFGQLSMIGYAAGNLYYQGELNDGASAGNDLVGDWLGIDDDSQSWFWFKHMATILANVGLTIYIALDIAESITQPTITKLVSDVDPICKFMHWVSRILTTVFLGLCVMSFSLAGLLTYNTIYNPALKDDSMGSYSSDDVNLAARNNKIYAHVLTWASMIHIGPINFASGCLLFPKLITRVMQALGYQAYLQAEVDVAVMNDYIEKFATDSGAKSGSLFEGLYKRFTGHKNTASGLRSESQDLLSIEHSTVTDGSEYQGEGSCITSCLPAADSPEMQWLRTCWFRCK